MFGKPADASTEETNDWFVTPLMRGDVPTDLIGPFPSQDAAWDWLEQCVSRKQSDGGIVFHAENTEAWEARNC